MPETFFHLFKNVTVCNISLGKVSEIPRGLYAKCNERCIKKRTPPRLKFGESEPHPHTNSVCQKELHPSTNSKWQKQFPTNNIVLVPLKRKRIIISARGGPQWLTKVVKKKNNPGVSGDKLIVCKEPSPTGAWVGLSLEICYHLSCFWVFEMVARSWLKYAEK